MTDRTTGEVLGSPAPDSTRSEEHVERAKDLFDFLLALQRTKREPVRLASAYARQNDGKVIWTHSLPEDPAIQWFPERTDGVGQLVSVDRIHDAEPPLPPSAIRAKVTGWEDPGRPPWLFEDPTPREKQAFEGWIEQWGQWADRELAARDVRDFYKDLYETRLVATNKSEEYELVAAVGCLSWQSIEGDPIQRHVLTIPIKIDVDEGTGRLSVAVDEASQPLSLEIEEFVHPTRIVDAERLGQLKADIAAFQGSPLDREALRGFLQRLSTIIDYSCDFDDAERELPPSLRPRLVWAPALIVRQRSGSGLLRVYQTIADSIESTGSVPPGFLPLVDPNRLPPVCPDNTPGAIFRIGDEAFLPLPINGRQLDVIDRLDSHAQVVVQGPPGTGKTHTIAALLSHLLAQGKRVLVTAHTDRALEEVRNKLPEAIKPLSVSVIGTSRDDMGDLKRAVETIANRSEQHDPARLAARLREKEARLDRLANDRADTLRQLVAARATEVQQWEVGGLSSTMAGLARFVASDADELSWISGLLQPADGPCPVAASDLLEHRELLLDSTLDAERDAASQQLIESAIPAPDEFAAMVHSAAEAALHAQRLNTPEVQSWMDVVTGWSDDVRSAVGDELAALIDAYDDTRRLPYDWAAQAVSEVTRGRTRAWTERYDALVAGADAAVRLAEDVIGPMTEVRVLGDPIVLEPLARNLAAHLQQAGDLTTGPDGRPKIGIFTNKQVKASVLVFEQVLVDGLPPTTARSIDALLGRFQLMRHLQRLDQEWQGWAMPPDPDLPPARRLRWHRDMIDALAAVTELASSLARVDRQLRTQGVRVPWADMESPNHLLWAISAAPVMAAAAASERAVQALDDRLSILASGSTPSPVAAAALSAVRDRDPQAYREALDRNSHLLRTAARLSRRQTLSEQLREAGLGVVLSLENTADDDSWDFRFATLDRAWRWLQVDTWLSRASKTDLSALQEKVSLIEDEITRTVAQLAANRAWAHALAPDRIDQQTRHDLQTYVQQVRRLGKGTGKNADHVRAEIRKAMNRSRGAVPVWIMPLYRIAEQLAPEENLFDVVIVDEASQASVEAVFLQYFAPKIVVVGDDKQVSPSGVGVDTQMLRDLADRHMPRDPYRHTSWDDPSRSLFDEARTRYGGVITLTEHRRCVPEIIGFSNQIAYAAEDVQLEPVRQVGTDRLTPIRTVFVSNGYRTRRNVNTPEALAIAERIEQCIADPAYAGMTMGVISLLGADQARTIRDILLERIPVQEWTNRDLLVGDASSFQGSERHVIFLSMVATVEPDHRAAALTADRYLQRFNVAASRAQDQMWLFHSVQLSQLPNPDDVRHQLLRYCLDEAARSRVVGEAPSPAHDEVRQEPFDSLFQQRVYNQLVGRGFDVRPGVEALRYRMDLVVRGGSRSLAIECDGDHWDGPETFESDLARQRELERCGWVFHRVRESAFYWDPEAEITRLTDALAERGIDPTDWAALEAGGSEDDVVVSGVAVVDRAEYAGTDSLGPTMETEHVEPVEDVEGVEDLEPVDVIPEPDRDPDVDAGGVVVEPPPLAYGPESAAHLRPYREFRGPVPSVDSPARAIAEGVTAIVAVEGPICESRLVQAYARAAGVRLGRLIRETIQKGISSAERRGLIEVSAVTRSTGRVIRLPEQPEVLVREKGPRILEAIPLNEVAAVVARCQMEGIDPDDEDMVFREVMALYGLQRLTDGVRDTLSLAATLTYRPGEKTA